MPDRLVDADENDSCMKLLVLERSFGRSMGVLGGLWGVPGVVSGDPGGTQGRRKNGGVLGWFWGPLGVVLEVWGDPRVSPGRSECYYFVGVSRLSEMLCV